MVRFWIFDFVWLEVVMGTCECETHLVWYEAFEFVQSTSMRNDESTKMSVNANTFQTLPAILENDNSTNINKNGWHTMHHNNVS